MKAKENQENSQCYYCGVFIFVCLATGAAITLAVLIYTWGYHGLDGSLQMTLTNCLNTYHSYKFADQILLNKTIFTSTLIAAFAGVISTIVALVWLVNKCKQLDSPSSCCKGFFYFIVSLICLTSIVPSGYYLTFQF